ncbi:uncharacterized protein M421DRAFT_150679 [Didymella exigua CBS 183.55]|uniref:Uncharacterized protein n=1 Tax=Didymella exigua CBS 183.55 TaxID=1150837 RepID=A0A6A5RLS3_9PLEO|nr:uncharacterized protein M421DRAFT_150679 [Didymella exigua CBS 183.55]KAF1928609.1 hypothetical protein M421DRAFT_150679 [Didymella exigua CBS 183.55]
MPCCVAAERQYGEPQSEVDAVQQQQQLRITPGTSHLRTHAFLQLSSTCCGGEPPISSSSERFQRANDKIPDFVKVLASKGIISHVNLVLTKLMRLGRLFGEPTCYLEPFSLPLMGVVHLPAEYRDWESSTGNARRCN